MRFLWKVRLRSFRRGLSLSDPTKLRMWDEGGEDSVPIAFSSNESRVSESSLESQRMTSGLSLILPLLMSIEHVVVAIPGIFPPGLKIKILGTFYLKVLKLCQNYSSFLAKYYIV